ncbi:MAG TPA: sigma-54 dependent transcriptional regulator [Gemmatimonadales bacterium]|jgi:DNA-binding NtrC family response regulator
MRTPVVAVLLLSGSFETVWDGLAEDCGAVARRVAPDEPPPSDAAAVIIAAGGAEEEALETLPAMERRRGQALLVAGAAPSHRIAAEAMRRGATDYFALPEDLGPLRRALASAVESHTLRAESGRDTADAFAPMIGTSHQLQRVLGDARRLAAYDGVTVLIQGETGTGKELLAQGMHAGSPRADGAFIAVNCAAIPETLLESELFGHERGAFTDAHQAKPGLFEEADRGTIFLDEIGHLPLELQGKLLRVLEDGHIRRVGGTRTRRVDVRVLTATNVDLVAAVHNGRFRADLYYRINVVRLELPALRERGDDTIQLAARFALQLAERYGLPVPPMTPAVTAALRAHSWPGNVRELRHAVERALLLSPAGTLDPSHFVNAAVFASAPTAGASLPFPATLDVIARRAAALMVERCEGNKSAAARALGISRARLQRLLDAAWEAS